MEEDRIRSHAHNNGETWAFPGGLTKREYFAGLAMQGLLSDNKQDKPYVDIANDAVFLADALLKELAK